MSRIDELKKQYPELNVTVFDVMSRLDTSKSYKYLPLLCKIFGKRFSPKEVWHKDDYSNGMLEIQANLLNKGISTDNLTDNQMYYMVHYLCDHFTTDTYNTLRDFMGYMDRGLIDNNDVTSYSNIDDVRGAVTLAAMKEYTKDLEGQVVKEYEDENWLAVRPLTFSSSVKYGASTRWCTTYVREKQYFEKYWRKGILVYFINKKSGYKFAGFKGLNGDSEFSFWNAEDTRIDYLDVNADDYLFPIVRRIFKSEQTNKNLSSNEIQEQVHEECIGYYEKLRIERVEEPVPVETYETTQEIGRDYPVAEQVSEERAPREIGQLLREMLSEVENAELPELPLSRNIRAEMTYSEDVLAPTMRA